MVRSKRVTKKTSKKSSPKRRRKLLHDTKVTLLVVFVNDLNTLYHVESHTEFLPRPGELIAFGEMKLGVPRYRVLEVMHVVESTNKVPPVVHTPVVYLNPDPEVLPWEVDKPTKT